MVSFFNETLPGAALKHSFTNEKMTKTASNKGKAEQTQELRKGEILYLDIYVECLVKFT